MSPGEGLKVRRRGEGAYGLLPLAGRGAQRGRQASSFLEVSLVRQLRRPSREAGENDRGIGSPGPAASIETHIVAARRPG